METEKLTYSVSEAAAALGIAKSAVYELIHADNDFPFIQIGKRLLIPADGLRRWVNRCGGGNRER